VWATVIVSTKTTLCASVTASNGDGRVVTSVSDVQTEWLRHDEYIVLIVLVDLEDLRICVWSPNLIGKSDIMSINVGGV